MIEINGRIYKEEYIRGSYFLYENNETIAIATGNTGLYIKGIKADVLKWFLYTGVNKYQGI